MNKHKLKFGFYLTISVVLTFGLSLSLQSLLAAWQAPTAIPPSGNTYSPIYNEYSGVNPDLNYLATRNLAISGFLLANGSVGANKYCSVDGTVCRSINELVDSGSHYFLLSNNKYNGDLVGYATLPANNIGYSGTDGLAAANAICLHEVNTYDFLGKNNRTFAAGEVSAFLCEGSGCNPIAGNRAFTFGVLGFPAIGGATFTTESSGRGPNDNASWSSSDRFGSTEGYWTGRNNNGPMIWDNSFAGNDCSDWTMPVSVSGSGGSSGSNDTGRWHVNSNYGCGTPEKMICVIDGAGTPDTGNALWTKTGNNIFNNNTGNVGIGTNNPQSRLDVGGDMRIISSGVRPTCDATNRSKIWLAQDNGSTGDTYAVCLRDGSSNYSWKEITQQAGFWATGGNIGICPSGYTAGVELETGFVCKSTSGVGWTGITHNGIDMCGPVTCSPNSSCAVGQIYCVKE
jgi:hypothetical protein